MSDNRFNGPVRVVYPSYRDRSGYIEIRFGLRAVSREELSAEDISFETGDMSLESTVSAFSSKRGKGGYEIKCRCRVRIDKGSVKRLHTKNLICLAAGKGSERQQYGLTCRWYEGKFAGVMTDQIFTVPEEGLSCYFMITKNNMVLTVRNMNRTDAMGEKVKLAFAFVLSKLMFWFRPVVLYEKNGARYEESGSIVYEKLMDSGYGNAYFILDRDYPFIGDIDERYMSHIVYKYTFRHYLCFFCAKTFVGSEMVAHAIELRPISKFVRIHISRGRYNYVFLQHGVMYMVSLDAESRSFFVNSRFRGQHRIVTSSELEVRHFMEQGGYDRKNLYLTGLPKFDRNVIDDGSDRIAIMLTWRPWEEKECKESIRSTSYYRSVKAIIDAVPEELRNRIWIMPHPLLQQAVGDQETDLSEYMAPDEKYDVLLRSVKVLITDYSSISYDAFYRGSNIIFYWEEKDECIARYGENAKLMLTEDLAFGDVCYDCESLSEAVALRVYSGQEEAFRQNYGRIVEFHDGRNTERLVDMMKKDGLI